jgi:hypothetical protein
VVTDRREQGMKELFEKLVRLIPAYFDALLPLITGPKAFIRERLGGDGTPLQDALLFLAISFAIGWILKIPLSRGGPPLLELGTDAAFELSLVMAYGAALILAWRTVGGRANVRKFLTIHFYYSGILSFIMSGLFLGTMGTLRAADPVLYRQIYEAAYGGNFAVFLIENSERLIASRGFRWSLWVQLAGYGAAMAWILAGWGAYRELNGISRIRSGLAGLMFCLFCVPVAALTFVIANALIK